MKNIGLTVLFFIATTNPRAQKELFAGDGFTVMTDIFFPGQPYDQVQCPGRGNLLPADSNIPA